MKWIEVQELIKKQIKEENTSPHTKLMTEKEVIKKYDISKMTARKVMLNLISENYIYVVKGSGYYVSNFHKENKVSNILSPLRTTSTKYFKTTAPLPIKELNLKTVITPSLSEKNWLSHVQFLYVGDSIIGYSINWAFQDHKERISKNLIGGKNHINFLKELQSNISYEKNNFSMKKTSLKDKQILLINHEYIPVIDSVFYDSKQKPIFIQVLKMLPEKFNYSLLKIIK